MSKMEKVSEGKRREFNEKELKQSQGTGDETLFREPWVSGGVQRKGCKNGSDYHH